jgi:hypothetical protein
MRNPSVNPQSASRMERVLARLRGSFKQIKAIARRPTPLYGLTLGIVAGVSLLVGISFFSSPRKSSAKNGWQLSAFASSETKEKVPANARQNRSAARAERKHIAAKAANAEKKGDSKKESEREKYASQATKEMEEVQLSPGATVDDGEGEEEESGTVRARGSWFHDQRAYPFQHIPSGALQEAIRQRDWMKQQQRAKSGGQISAQGIISFPGDALWHLMGPQPVNELVSVNSGFPTASGRVTAIAVDPTDATGNTVYIGAAAGGVWKTTNGGTTWTALTDTQPSLSIGSIAIDPNSCTPAPCKTIYVGTGEENFNGDAYYGAGILKSTDGGTTWTQIGASTFAQVLGPNTGGALIGSISVQPGNSQIILAAVSFFVGGTVGGIYRSTDGGTTWTEDAAPRGVAATAVVFESTSNAGTTATAWAAMGNPFGETINGIYKSVDSGLTWTKQTSTLPVSGAGVGMGRITLGYAPSTAGGTATVYAAIADASTSSSSFLGFFKTADGGTTWASLPSTPAFCNQQCFYDMAVGVNPTTPSFVVVGGGAFTNNSTSLFKSTDGGTTWTTSTAPNDFTLGSTSVRPHVDTHAFGFNASGGRLFVGNDGGMWRTDNPGTTPPLWVNLNATLATIQFYPGPSAGIGDENYGFGGTQDNDTELFSGSLAWDNVFACGDGGFTAIDPSIPTSIYTTCDKLAIHVVRKSVFNGSIATGQTFGIADVGIVHGDRMQFIPPLALDENNSNTLYFGSCRVYQTTDGAATWNPISGDLSAGNTLPTTCPAAGGNPTITAMNVSHQSSLTLLAGTSNGKVWQTTTGGAAWNEIDNGLLPNRHVTAVKTKRDDATNQIAYVTFSGFGSCGSCGLPGHVFKTINGGTSWVNISGDLPDIPVNDIIVDHNSGPPTFDALYIATDVGVFACPDPEATTPCQNWTVLGDGLPNSPVLGLAMRRNSRILRAATHGRSMWSIQLTDVSPPAIALLSSVTPGAVNVGAATTPVNIFGLNFSANTQVFFDGASVGAATFVDTTHLTITVNSSFFTDGHVFAVTLTDPQGADNSSLPFTVMNPILGTPTLTNPNTTAGVPYTLHFTGSNFVNSTAVVLTTFGNSLLLGGVASANGTVFDVPVPAAFLTTAMPVAGTITNPLPGGGPSPAFAINFTINPGTIIFNPSPIALSTFLGTTSLTTNVAVINTSASSVTITAQSITGTNLANFSFAAPTSGTTCNFPSSGQSGTVSVTLAANGGTCNFGITYTAAAPPGNAVSNATLSVTDNASGSPQSTPIQGTPIPPTVLLLPVDFGAVTVGTTSPTMNATLSNFSPSSINVTSAFTVSGANQADFHIVSFAPNGDGNAACPTAPFALASFASCDVTLTFTPSLPAGNETAQLNITASVSVTTINPNLTGVGIEITSIVPSLVATGGPGFTLTVNGGGFAPSAVVNVGPNGTNPRLTTFVSANKLLASIPASDIAAAGNLPISVTTPVPGGTTSEPKTLIVGQAPSATNDNIKFATVIAPAALPFRITEDTTQATTNTGGFNDPAPACATKGGTVNLGKEKSVWFTFTPTSSGKVIAHTRFSGYDTVLSVWTSNAPTFSTFTPVACNDDFIPGTLVWSLAGFNVTAGTQYFFMVTDVAGVGGTMVFSLDFASAAPANDDFNNAIDASATPFSNTANSIQATLDTGTRVDPTPSCTVGQPNVATSGKANSVWYKYVATANGTVTADTLTSLYNTILTVVTGSPGSFSEVACNDNAGTGGAAVAQSQASFPVSNGTTYFIMASAFNGEGGTTNFHLTFSATTAPGVAFNPTNIPFGNQKVATTSATTNVQLTNNGSATLNVTGITKTGTDPTQFAIVAPTSGTACSPLAGPFSLNAGISCNFGVQFAPTTTGAKSANISVADNASGSPQTVPLTGTGAVPMAALAPANIAFGNQTIATSSATSDVTVSNTGLVSMSITSITLTGTDPTQFTLGAPTSGTPCPLGASALAAGANCKVGVKFAPTTLGAKSANVSVADDAAGSPQTVPLTGTGVSAPAPLVSLNPTSLPFGNQKVGTTSAVLSATLTNTGNANLNITAVSITGTNAADFTSSGTTCTGTTVLAQNGTCTLGATFTPGAQGARSAAFTITDNASGSPHSLPMSGTGTVPGVGLAPANIAFGNQVVSTASATTDVTLTNSGTATLNITSITLTGTDPTQFTLGAPTSGTACPLGASALAAGANCKVGVKFAPTTTGAKSANVSFADDATGSPQTIPLTGTGTAPGAALAPANIAFGNQRTGTSSATTDVTLTNGGTATLNITSITLTGTDPTQFTLGAPTSGTACPLGPSALAAGANCKVGVKFAPTAIGAKSANVSVADDATGSPQTVPLTGTGTAPAVSLAPANIAFGNQRTATSSATTDVTVTNSGTAALNITSITLTGTDPTQFTLGAPTTGTACPLGASALAAGANCKVGVKFAPTTTGAKSANVSVADDATGSPQTVPLTGTGTAPAVTLAPANIAFGNQVVSTQSAVTDITITNSGTAALNITSITLTGANPGDFVVGAPTSGTACPLGASVLNAGANCKVGAKFSPTTTGARSASVSVADDATGSPQTVPLTGTGTAATVTFAPANVAFGNLLINTTSATTDVTLTNGGTAPLNITSITLTGTDPTQFTLGAPTTGTACPLGASALTAGTNCKFGVKFAPTSTGPKSASVGVADDAAGSPHVVPLTGTGTAPAVTLAPANVAFGNQHIATSSATNDVTVTNSGTAALNITSITLTGTDPTQFTLGAPTTGTACPLGASALAAGANCKVGVKFAPTTTGAKSANVSVADDATGSPQTVPLTGTGTAPAVTLAPANIAFGNQAIATSSATTDVTVTNSGTAALNITSITLTGTDPTQFTLGAPTTGTACPLGASALAAGANCKVGVKFAPTTTGAKSASVSVADDATGSPQTVPLTGTGTSPAVALAPANIAFGNQPISTSSATTDVTVTNSGTGTLNITSITLTGTDPTQFTLGAPTTGTACPLGASALNAGSNCKVGVKFAPTTTGNKSASVSVADDATGSPQTVPLSGTGTTATITITPSPQNFANQRKGTTSAAATVTVTNVGGASVTLAAATPVTFAGANAGDFATAAGTTCTGGAVLAASGGACSIMITFTPSTAGAETATVNVAFQGATPTATDTLNGTGVFPAVTITPNPLPFGNQLVAATSAALTATLKNTGTDTLNLAAANALVLGGANAGDFAVVAGTTCVNSAVIAVNGTCLINVTFTPALAGARAATITITDDVAPAQILNLTGTGDTPASVTATAGTPQSIAINTAFATALQATVKDAGGSVLSGVLVTFTAPSSGASGIFTGTGTATATATTNASGIATAPTFTANATSGGPYTVTATVVGVATPANFSLTNLAGSAASITATAGTPQSVVIGNAFAALKATVKDSGGNLVSGVTVTFAAPSVGASGTFAGGATTANVNTDATGVATAPTFTANSTPGPYTVTATVAGVVAPANFLLTNLPGVPTITTLSPTSTTVGGVAFTLTVNGTNFVATSKVNFNGAAKTTTFVNGTQLTAAILATDITTAGVVNVTVTTPAPGGGTSTAATFTINNVQPILTTLVPSSTTAGAAAFALTVNGNAGSFVNGAVVSFNGNAKTTTFMNNAQLTAAITAADVATAGSFNVVVTNPAPSVGPSAPATFTVNNPVPTLANAAVGGKTHVAGGAQFTLTLTGTNFVAGSKVNFGTNPPLTPTSQTATQLQVTVPASDVATAGPVNVTVTNPSPGGGTTTPAFVFTVDGFTVAGPANTTVKAGSQATLTITVTPTPLANGFANPVTFDVTGLPAHTSFTFSPTSVTPSAGAQTATLTIKTTARSGGPPLAPFELPKTPLLRLLPVMWLLALIAGIYAMLILRRTPRLRRYAAIVPLALLIVTGAALAGCSGAMVGTPAGPAQLTITATSGTMSQATPASSVVLTVQ